MHSTAHVLLAHGSRDPHWPAMIEAVAACVRRLEPGTRVRCAYLERARPDLASAIDGLVAEGARSIAVWPMFLGLGRHAREDLPRLTAAAQERHPSVRITLQSPIAEQTPVQKAMAQAILHKQADL
ncbi:MAG: CbiX/SirB N-terminal domain-containing protein [Burkholderiaceae bacterium]|jgi:sirohydrochlorin cobaltochelatase|nr:CbiX/SirB N-terminal domain-containing protein [Burkholderiaceae bacterium]